MSPYRSRHQPTHPAIPACARPSRTTGFPCLRASPSWRRSPLARSQCSFGLCIRDHGGPPLRSAVRIYINQSSDIFSKDGCQMGEEGKPRRLLTLVPHPRCNMWHTLGGAGRCFVKNGRRVYWDWRGDLRGLTVNSLLNLAHVSANHGLSIRRFSCAVRIACSSPWPTRSVTMGLFR
jgi:hypothetical protein